MRKTLVFVLLLLAVAHSLTDKEIIQQGLNGFFEQNKLSDPTTIVPCLDDATAHKIVVFMGDLLQKAAKGSLQDLINLIPTIQKFLDSIPEPVKTCLNGNKEAEALGLKYGITPDTDPDKIIKKLVAYGTLHYLQVHKWFGASNDLWQAGKYYQCGFEGAGYLHTVLGTSSKDLKLSDKEILQEGLNGFFQENGLPNPETIVPCLDDATAHKTVIFITDIFAQASRGSLKDLIGLVTETRDFINSIPEDVSTCVRNSK